MQNDEDRYCLLGSPHEYEFFGTQDGSDYFKCRLCSHVVTEALDSQP